jgi:hypothetical protein
MIQGWCIHCQNTGWLDCYCEGDMCGCENGGEYPCPYCDENKAWDNDIEGMSPEEAIASRKETK